MDKYILTTESHQKIVFLIKTMKRKFLSSTLKEGSFCFNCAEVFNNSTGLTSAQHDRHDAHRKYNAKSVRIYPINSKDGKCGCPIKIAQEATIRAISGKEKNTPYCCFRLVEENEIIYSNQNHIGHFRLGNVVDRIREEFPHDAYILVYNPTELLQRINEKESCFARSIHYGEKTEEFEQFLDESPHEQKYMFEKDDQYSWQKEFRIALSPQETPQKKIIDIGSIEDIAIGGNLEELKNGVSFLFY